MTDTLPIITLINGPWNGYSIPFHGTKVIKMAIAERWQGNRPAIGARSGAAIYEPGGDGPLAFWLENRWDGITTAIVESSDP